MCMATGSTPEVQEPERYAAQKSPDGGAVLTNAERRVTDNQKSAAQTIFTTNSGVEGTNPTTYKQLLGQ